MMVIAKVMVMTVVWVCEYKYVGDSEDDGNDGGVCMLCD